MSKRCANSLFGNDGKGRGRVSMGVLPYWDRDVDLDIAPWVSYSLDFAPVSINSMHSEQLRSIAASALEVGSEFLYLKSLRSGRVGTLFPDHLIDPERDAGLRLGFSMVFGYSSVMETLTHLLAQSVPGLKAGLTLCGVWDRFMLLDECKVIALASENPFFDEEPFLNMLTEALQKAAGKNTFSAFFAERFGYRRGAISYETDDVTQLAISQLLFDFELEETRKIVGPLPQVALEGLFRETREDSFA